MTRLSTVALAGRSRDITFLGSTPEKMPATEDPCSVAAFVSDLGPKGDATLSEGAVTGLLAGGAVAAGAAAGAIIDEKHRGRGAAIGGALGAVMGLTGAFAKYMLWRAAGGSAHNPGACSTTGLPGNVVTTTPPTEQKPPVTPTKVNPVTPPTQTPPPAAHTLWDGAPLPAGTTILPSGAVTYKISGPGDYGIVPIAAKFHKDSVASKALLGINNIAWGKAPAGTPVNIPAAWVK